MQARTHARPRCRHAPPRKILQEMPRRLPLSCEPSAGATTEEEEEEEDDDGMAKSVDAARRPAA